MLAHSLGILLFLVTVVTVEASKLIDDHIYTYKKLIRTLRSNEAAELDISALQFLVSLHDDDSVCSDACMNYVKERFGDHSLSWDGLKELVEKIYEGMISDDPYEPQEIKLALTDDITSMKVMFVTWGQLETPMVKWSLASSGDALEDWQTAPAINYTYTVPQKWWPIFTGMIYEVDMSALHPATSYLYRVGGFDTVNNTMRYSDVFEFKSAPIPNAMTKTTIGVLADQGTWMLLGFMVADKLATMQDELGIDLTMIVGDLSYAGLSSDFIPLNITSEDEFERVWDLYGIQSQRTAATRPFMVGNGNHERFYDWAAYTNRYKMPFESSGGNQDGFWYSYDYGNVHWVSISSEHSLDEGSEQKTWLERDLKTASSNRNVVPWIVLSLHKPMYCSDESTPQGFRELLEPLMLDIDVDLVFVGHMHAYERIHPVNNYEVTVYPSRRREGDHLGVDTYESKGKGPVYIVQGNTGAMQFEQWIQPQPAWSALRFSNGYIPRNKTNHEDRRDRDLGGVLLPTNYTDTFGFGVATFVNSSHMYYRMIPVTGDIGSDIFWIVKEH